jgi:hypothetical protein
MRPAIIGWEFNALKLKYKPGTACANESIDCVRKKLTRPCYGPGSASTSPVGREELGAFG